MKPRGAFGGPPMNYGPGPRSQSLVPVNSAQSAPMPKQPRGAFGGPPKPKGRGWQDKVLLAMRAITELDPEYRGSFQAERDRMAGREKQAQQSQAFEQAVQQYSPEQQQALRAMPMEQAMTILSDRMFPDEQPQPFTLSPGSVRYGPNGKVIANNPSAADEEGYERVTLADGIYEYIPGQPESMRKMGDAPANAQGNGFAGGGVQSTFVDADGNLQIVKRDGTIQSSGMGVQNPFQITNVGDVPTAINRRTGEAMPISTPQEVGTNKATVDTIVANEGDRREAQKNLPDMIAKAEQSIDTIDQLLNSPGFESRYGFSSIVPAVPGTPMADTQALIDQVGGQAFLEAFESLKGGGQITEIEGQKATQAKTRLTAQGTQPAAAREAAREFIDIIKKGVERAKAQSGGSYQANASDAPPLRYNPETGEFE